MSMQKSSAEERKLLWKIDTLLMPLMTVSYGLQFVSLRLCCKDARV
jgi:hypothetical protein